MDPSRSGLRATAGGLREATISGDRHVNERNRRLRLGILTSIASRGVLALVPLVMIPITLQYLGTELYGLWMAVAALTGMAAFADLGLGNSLMTKLPPCYSSGDSESARRHISNAYALSASLAAIVIVALLLWSRSIPWSSLFNAEDASAASHSGAVALICLTAFLANVPLSLVLRVQYAYQRVGQANMWQAVGSLFAIPLVIAAVRTDAAAELVVGAAVIAAPIANAVNTAWVFKRQSPEIAPALRHVDWDAARGLVALSGRFLLLTIVMSLAMNVDNLVVARVLGLEAVTAFTVPARLFAQLGLLVSAVSLPLWPANGEALARGDLHWVRRITRRMTLASTLGVVVPGLIFVIAGDHFLSAWLGTDLGASRLLLAGLAAWWATLAAISPRFMVQNSAGVVLPQLLGWTAYLLLSVPLKYWAVASFGVDVLPLTGVVVYAIAVVPTAVWGYRSALARTASRSIGTVAA